MSQIKTIALTSLNSGNFYQLVESIVAISQAEPLVSDVLRDLSTSVPNLQNSFKKEKLSDETAQLVALDQLRDRGYIKIKRFAEAYTFDDQSPDNIAAANKILDIIDQYGKADLINFDYNKESAYLTNFIKDLADNAQDAVDSLKLADDIAYLKICNDNFIAKYAGRGDAAQAIAGVMPFYKLRPEVAKHYNNFVGDLESLQRIDKTHAAKFEALIGRINIEIEKYKLLIPKAAPKPNGTPMPPKS
jgi:Family of unknown function (DUF6261)